MGRSVAVERANMLVELRRTNDVAWLTMAEAMLRGEGLDPIILDAASSVVDGSIGAVPRRLMIARPQAFMARSILTALDEIYG
ncbi:MAG: DUF2007 domain-containing protein [Alphaproteobacteria bacterium]|jgi:hypothetical protein|nr:DUF2007 domain-containing protein [Alphaproteobacteria bacterium]